MDNPPGQHYAYSNFGYCVLGRVIEKITGQVYADYVRANILNRCGVTDMTIAGNTLAQRQANEVKYFGDGDDPYAANVTRMDSHGGWIARPADIVQYFRHVDGVAKPPNILKPQTIQIMTTPTAVNPSDSRGSNVNKVNNWWHLGDLVGTMSEAVRANSGFCWAGFLNCWRHPPDPMLGDLDKLEWAMVGQVKELERLTGGCRPGAFRQTPAARTQCDISTGTVMDFRIECVTPPSTNSRSRECP